MTPTERKLVQLSNLLHGALGTRNAVKSAFAANAVIENSTVDRPMRERMEGTIFRGFCLDQAEIRTTIRILCLTCY